MPTSHLPSPRGGVVCRVFTSALLVLSALLAGSSPLLAAKTPEPANKDRVPEGLSASDWQSIRAAHEAWQHAIEPVKGGWQARNPAQQWTTKFDGRGFEAKPQSAEWTWGLELRSYGAGDEQREVKGTPEVKTEGHRLAYHWDETVQEWYVNDGRGLEHGFSVQERPPGPSEAPLTFVLATRGPLRAAVTGNARAVDYRDKSGATVLTYSGLRVWDADGRELAARFAPAKDGVTLQVDAKNARYPLLIDPIAQQAYVKASNTGADDQFGASVAISGNTVVVGAPGEDSSTPGVNNLTPNESAVNSGAAYVFVRNGTTWSQQAYLKASTPGGITLPPGSIVSTPGDAFASSVAIDGDTVVVGAPNANSTSGAAYVFVRNGTAWSQQTNLIASNPGSGAPNNTALSFNFGDQFGGSVAISGNTAVVGAPNEDGNTGGVNGAHNDLAFNSGAAYVFLRNGSNWGQPTYLKARFPGGGTQSSGFIGSSDVPGDQFGGSVAVSGDTIVIGAMGEDGDPSAAESSSNNSMTNSGAVYVFVRSGENWNQQAYVKATNAGMSDGFGVAVAVSSNTLAAGAPGEDSSTTGVNSTPNELSSNSGAAYVFLRSGTAWTQQAYVKATNTGADDQFGRALALAADVMAVGATGEDSSATGINGNVADNAATNSGAAYVFLRNGTSWTQQAYLKSSNTQINDFFGVSVAVSGDTVVAGAFGEDSSATGINGNASDNAAPDSGAAYVFSGLGPAPVITSANTTNGQVGVPFSYQITTTGAAPDSYGAVGLPLGLNINTASGLISGTPSVNSGPASVFLTASNAGGVGNMTLSLTVTNPAPPVITSTNAATGQVGQLFAYQITTSGGTPTSYNATGLPAGLSVGTGNGAISGTPTTAGVNAVTLSASNAGGTGTRILTLSVVPVAPVITSTNATNGQVGVGFNYQITTSGGTPTSFGASNLPAGLNINTSSGAISGTPTTPGTNPVTLSASNAGGVGTLPLTLAVLPAAPVITSTNATNGQVGLPFNYQITTSGGTPTSFGASNLPAGLSINTGSGAITGTPTTAGTNAVNLSAGNVGGTNSRVLTLSVTIPPPPVINSPLTAGGQVGVPYSYQITSSGGTPTSFGASNLPPGLSINTNTGLITGIPTTFGSRFNFVITASNAGGSDTNFVTSPMRPAAPVITSTNSASGQVGSPFNYQITTSGGTPTSFGASNLPAGLIISAASGAITGTPTIAGTNTVDLTASNSGGSNNLALTLTVTNPPAPVITSTNTASGQVGSPFNYQITTSGGTPTSFDAAILPAGLSVNATTGAITGSPAVAGTFAITLTATNAGGTGTSALTLTVNQQPAIAPAPNQGKGKKKKSKPKKSKPKKGKKR